MNFNNFKEKDMIILFYELQEEKIDEILKKTDVRIKNQLQKMKIEKIVEDFNCKKELRDIFQKLEDNYNIKIAEYNKEMYKQGFIDGVNVILNCLKS